MIIATKGIVLRRKKDRESDIQISLFREEGQVVFLRAHGIQATKKRSLLALEPGSFVEVRYYDHASGAGSIKEITLIERFENIKKDYLSLLYLSYLLELTATSLFETESSSIFRLLSGALTELSRMETDIVLRTDFPEWVRNGWRLLFLVFFKIRLLKLTGLLGDPESCQECGRPPGKKASWLEGEAAFLCESCSPSADSAGAFGARVVYGATTRRFSEFLNTWIGRTKDSSGLIREINIHLDTGLSNYHGRQLESEKELYKYLFGNKRSGEL